MEKLIENFRKNRVPGIRGNHEEIEKKNLGEIKKNCRDIKDSSLENKSNQKNVKLQVLSEKNLYFNQF